jgi:hypothetical protein
VSGTAEARIKGTAILSIVKALRAGRDEAREALPQALHHYLENRVLVSEWYPESDQLELLRALSKIIPDQGMDPWEFMGRFTARRDLSGLYKNMFRPGDPAGTLKGGVVLWKSYHDTGRCDIVFEGDGSARVSLLDYGLPSREMCGILGGWYGELVRMSGGREAEVSHEICVHRGGEACTWTVKWQPPEA